jgi:large subunit ribosomal protein L22
MSEIAVAKGKYLKISPQKSQLVVNLIKGKDAGEALTILKFSKRKKAANIVTDILRSAIANAQVKFPNIDVDNLYISKTHVGQAPYLKRFRPAPRGRAMRILKRYAHISLYLDERKGK